MDNKFNSIVIEFSAPLSGTISIIPNAISRFEADIKSFIISKYREGSVNFSEQYQDALESISSVYNGMADATDNGYEKNFFVTFKDFAIATLDLSYSNVVSPDEFAKNLDRIFEMFYNTLDNTACMFNKFDTSIRLEWFGSKVNINLVFKNGSRKFWCGYEFDAIEFRSFIKKIMPYIDREVEIPSLTKTTVKVCPWAKVYLYIGRLKSSIAKELSDRGATDVMVL